MWCLYKRKNTFYFSVVYCWFRHASVRVWLGHNTDGKYFVTNSKLGFNCETRPRRVMVFIDKTRDGVVSAVTDVEVRDVACGQNHVVSCQLYVFDQP